MKVYDILMQKLIYYLSVSFQYRLAVLEIPLSMKLSSKAIYKLKTV